MPQFRFLPIFAYQCNWYNHQFQVYWPLVWLHGLNPTPVIPPHPPPLLCSPDPLLPAPTVPLLTPAPGLVQAAVRLEGLVVVGADVPPHVVLHPTLLHTDTHALLLLLHALLACCAVHRLTGVHLSLRNVTLALLWFWNSYLPPLQPLSYHHNLHHPQAFWRCLLQLCLPSPLRDVAMQKLLILVLTTI